MLYFCPNCYAAYERDFPMDRCENLLCGEEMTPIDPVSVLILANLQNICYCYNLNQTVMLADTLNFYEFGVAFQTKGDGAEFLKKCEALLRDAKYADKIAVDAHEDDKSFFCIDIGIAGCYDDFVGLESVVKVERIFTLLMFLCELCDMPVDEESLAAFVQSEMPDQVVTTGAIG